MPRQLGFYGWIIGLAVTVSRVGWADEPPAPAAPDRLVQRSGIAPTETAETALVEEVSQQASPAPAPVPQGETPPPPEGEAEQSPAPPNPPAPPKPPPQPWKLNFFDNDFSYKKDPNHTWLFGEDWKEVPLDILPWDCCDESWFSTGGEVRYRLMDERNRLRPGGPAQSNYDLWRWRHYVDYHHSDLFRVYVEMIEADMNRNKLPTTGIDVNQWDLQNAFVDVNIGELDGKPIWFRAGRQELLYGSQRLVSPLDWANTRRNFEGLKMFTKGTNWDYDLWFTRPVNTATFGDGPVARFDNSFDSPNMDHTFSGFWATNKSVKNHTFDFYWLWDRNTTLIAPGYPTGNRHTLASRWLGNFPILDACNAPCRTYHFDFEGGYQFGDEFQRDVQAGFFVIGAGHTWNQVPWEPNLWFFYDYASGDRNPTNSTTNTFNQQYGLVHAYLGQIDNIARQNISDLNLRAGVKPTKKFDFQTQMHFFNLASDQDVLYNITGSPVGKPGTGHDVGRELDLVATYTYNPNLNVQLGYFWFWYGSFVQNNAPRGKAEQLYLQTTFRY